MKILNSLFKLLFVTAIIFISFSTSATAQDFANVSTVNESCSGYCDGQVTFDYVSPGHVGPYKVELKNFTCGSAPTFTIVLDTFTTNNIVIDSVCGCSQQFTVFVTDLGIPGATAKVRSGISITSVSPIVEQVPPAITAPLCPGDASGSIQITDFVTFVGGTPPYNYNWSTSTAGTTISNQPAGNYTVTITDLNGCDTNFTYTISDPAPIQANFDITDSISCFGFSDANVTITPGGGNGGVTFSWSGPGITNPNLQTQTNLGVGVYYVSLQDNQNCTATDSVEITQPTELLVTKDSVNVSCGGYSDGSAQITITGGTTPYSITWNGPSGFNQTNVTSVTNLIAGLYTVDVVDANSCSVTLTINITEPTPLVLNMVGVNALCFDSANATTTVNVSGGTAPYTYLWLTGNAADTTFQLQNLDIGTYTVIVNDNNACSDTDSVAVSEPPLLVANGTGTDLSCFQINDGTINANPIGGVGGYSYNWTTGITTQSATGLSANTYFLTVTDANNCPAFDTVVVSEPTQLNAVLTADAQVSCFGDSDADASVTINGGTAGYSQEWYNPASFSTNNAVTNLAPGNYFVVATDANNCTDTAFFNIFEPNEIFPTTNVIDATCFGLCNGTATASATGGNGGFTFNWSNGSGGPTANGLCGDSTYTVTITDINSCEARDTITVNQPTEILANTSAVNVSCKSGSDGIGISAPTGGVGNFGFSWGVIPVNTNDSLIGVTAGTYFVTVTDGNNCTKIDSVVITEPDTITATFTPVLPSCNGSANGALTVNPIGGTAPYSVVWNNDLTETNFTYSGLVAGTYNVSITDANNCSVILQGALTEPAELTADTFVTEPTCGGTTDGTAAVINVQGGTGPYTYLWSAGAQTTDTITNIGAGTYTVTITDANNCTTNQIVVVDNAIDVVITSNITAVSCSGLCNAGSFSSASGGLPPYAWSWSDGASTDSTRNDLCPIIYIISATDANGCIGTDTINVALSSNPQIQDSTVNISCFGLTDGITIGTAIGGNPAYTYNWYAPNPTANPTPIANTDTLTGLSAGDYTLIVEDQNNCSDTASYTVVEPTQLVSTPSTVNVSCFGLSNGVATITASGGTAPYQYNWDAGCTTPNCTGLIAGQYIVTLTDTNSCEVRDTLTITQPNPINVTVLDTNTSCFNTSDGSIRLNVSGGTGPYTFNWSNGLPNANYVNGLSAGTYNVTISDNNSCDTTLSIVLGSPNQLIANATATDVLCNGDVNGTLNAFPTGGTAPYSYNWVGTASTKLVNNVSANTYVLIVSDINSCADTDTVVVAEPLPLTLGFAGSSINCFGDATGQAEVNVSGGTGPYNYLWNDPSAQTDTIASGLSAGTYTVTVTDNNSCSAVDSVTLTEPTQLTVSFTITQSSCSLATGVIFASASGGTGPYTHSWNDLATGALRTNLPANIYTDTVTDANGCTITAQATVNNLDGITGEIINTTDVDCYGVCDGSALVTPIGGVAPITFAWNDPSAQTTATASNLCAGTYTVTMTDANGCARFANVLISEPDSIDINLTVADPSCIGTQNGYATTNVIGGTPGYNYSWSNGGVNSFTSGLQTGNYSITVTDNLGCTKTETFAVVNPAPVAVAITTTDVLCSGDSSAIAVALASGGNAPYSYNWNNGFVGATLSNVGVGTYTVTATDANGCTATNSTVVNEPTPIQVSQTVTPANCGQADGSISIVPSGGTAPYTINWGGNVTDSTITNLNSGIYCVTITDANGCSESFCIGVPSTNGPSISIDSYTDATCANIANGSATVSASGSTPINFAWSNGQAGSTVSNLAAGNYIVVATDNNGCSSSDTVVIGNRNVLENSFTISQPACNGDASGSAVAVPNGGSAPYTFSWSNGDAVASANNLSAGAYSVTITDLLGCSGSFTTTITEPTAVSISVTKTNAICNSDANGTAVAIASGGTPGYTYTWSNGSVNNAVANLSAGTYTVTATDNNGCSVVGSTQITEPTVISATETITDATCDTTNGAISLVVSGGTGTGFTYSWSPSGASSANLNNIAAGIYTVSVSDSKGCSESFTYGVNNSNGPTTSVATSNVSCFGNSNGSATITAVGNGPFTYFWSPSGATTNTSNTLAAGDYTVQVFDVNNCLAVEQFTITQPNELTLTSTVTNIDCNGNGNGSIALVPAGGSIPYSYTWDNGGTSSSISNLQEGQYSVTVSDNNSCSTTASFFITEPNALNAALTAHDINCFGLQDGSIASAVTGGTSPYTYSWTSGLSTASISNLAAGTYTLTLTDANNCVVNASATINEPTQLTNALAVSQIDCFGNANGSATNTTSGGTAPYDYTWNINGLAANAATGLDTGNYTVLITDDNGCFVNEAFTISQPTELVADSFDLTLATCGNTNGSIQIYVSGGTPNYNYQWNANAGNATTAAASGIGAGSMVVTVTDANNCTKTFSRTLANLDGPTLALTKQDVGCNGDSTGWVKVDVTGGTQPYAINWLAPLNSTADSVGNLPSGTYVVEVTDASNCLSVDTVDLLDNSSILLNLLVSNITCNNANDGSIIAVATGPATPFTYSWNTGSVDTALVNLAPGKYVVQVTDTNGCIVADSATITNPPILAATVSTTQASCFNTIDGSASVAITGGVSPYSISWSNSSSTSNTATGLAAGPFTVTVTDARNCVLVLNDTIDSPPAITSTATVTDVNCGGANGEISIAVSGGTPFNGSQAYTFSWNNGVTSTTNTAVNVGVGSYQTIITDSLNCADTLTNSIVDVGSPIITVDSITNLTCSGIPTGEAFISVTGGSGPYTYLWSNGDITQDVTGLAAGSQTVSVTDANNCTVDTTFNVTEPIAISISITPNNPTCNVVPCNGSAIAVAAGGTGSKSLLWSTGSTNNTIIGLCAATYFVTATDANGCTAVDSVSLSDIGGPTAVNETVTNPLCNSDSTGKITTNAVGGTQPYTYNWSIAGNTNDSITNIAAGNYVVTVTDANGCILISPSIAVTQPTAITTTTASNDAQCGILDGEAIVSATGGTGAYTYNWSTIPAQTNDTASGLDAGIYFVTVTDANGCTTIDTANVNNFGAVAISIASTTQPNCFGQSNGAIDISISGGIAPYNYSWTNPTGFTAGTQDISGISAATYSLTVTDAQNCASVTTIPLGQPALLASNATVTDETCTTSNGKILTNVSGGIAPYSINWAGFGVADSLTNISAGSYALTITDNNGCTRLDTIDVLDNAAPNAFNFTVVNVNCFGDATGSVLAEAVGGTAPYNYSWTNPTDNDSLIENLSAGSYIVNVIDANNCSFTDTATVQENALISATFNLTNADCGASNGAATVVPLGGTGNYTYTWDAAAGNATTASVTNLTAGFYTVTVTDDSLCSQTFVASINNNNGPQITLDSIQAVSCFGLTDGGIFTTVTGTNLPLTIQWSNGQTTADAINLAAGNDTIVVTDALGCITSEVYTVTQPTQLIVNAAVNGATCNQSNGNALAVATGGTPNYTYAWSNSSTNAFINGLPGNSAFVVTATDANGCTALDTAIIQNVAPPSGLNTTVTNASCYGTTDGEVSIASVIGGTAPFSYSWNNGSITSTTGLVGAGNYAVTITDASNCLFSTDYTVTEPDSISGTIVVQNSTCLNADGEAVITNITGGTAPYTFLWDDALAQTNDTASNLLAGTYNLTVTDANGCSSNFQAYVSDITGPTITLDSLDNIACFGQTNGNIYTTVTGSNPITLGWNTGATTDDLLNIGAGTYVLTATDGLGCTSVQPFTISEPNQLTGNLLANNSACNQCDGSILAQVSGGTGSTYNLQWNTGSTASFLNNLCPNVYVVTITDQANCSVVDSITISDINGPQALTINETPIECNGDATAALGVNVFGGTPGYVYSWSPSISTNNVDTVNNVAAGNYAITVTDALGCQLVETFTVNQPAAINATFNTTDATCGVNNGAIATNVTGGTGAYNYLWSFNALTTPNLNNLLAGTYTLTVTDGNNCSESFQALVNNPTGPSITLNTLTNVTCNGFTNGAIDVTVTGINPVITTWNTGATTEDISGLSAGVYTLTAQDSLGCITSSTFTITQPDSILSNAFVQDATCGNCNGSIVTTTTGGNGNFIYNWNNSEITASINNLCAGSYSVTITDANGCTTTENMNINNIGGPSAVGVNSNDISCFGLTDGNIGISVVGGTTPYLYTWSDATFGNTDTLSNLGAGTYTVTVTDANGCQIVETITLQQPTEIVAQFTELEPTCGASDGGLQVQISGGVNNGTALGYDFLWLGPTLNPIIPNITVDSITNIAAGVYNVSVTDGINCSEVFNYNLQNINAPVVTLDQLTNPTCFGDADGSIEISITGANPPFAPSWIPIGNTSEDIYNLTSGNYTVQVVDDIGCITFESFELVEPDELDATFTVTNTTCGTSNGELTVAATGGTGALNFIWNNGATSNALTGLSSGVYQVQVSDALGCSQQFSTGVNDIGGPTNISINKTDVTCYDGTNGAITANAIGGTAPYIYSFVPGGITGTSTISGLSAGTYQVEAIDANGCSFVKPVTITEPNPISDSIYVTPAECGINNGTVTVAISGGTSPFTFNPAQTLAGLAPGPGSITVSDAAGCSQVINYTISATESPVLQIDATDLTCYSSNDGTATVTVVSGSGSYSYQWLNSSNTAIAGETNPTTSATLAAGIYTVSVTDLGTGCPSFAQVEVTQPDSIQFGLSSAVDVLCFGDNNGSASVVAFGGTFPLNYQWDANANNQTATTAVGLSANNYFVTVTDANNCFNQTSIAVNSPNELSIDAMSATNAYCSTASDGSIQVTISGGVAPFDYAWGGPNNFNATTEDIANLVSGTYVLTLTDANNCTTIDSAVVANQIVLSVQAINDTNLCEGSAVVQLSAQASGTANPVTYSWFEVNTGGNLGTGATVGYAPQAGENTVEVTATDGPCFAVDTVLVNVYPLPIVDAGVNVTILTGATHELGGDPTGPFDAEYAWSPLFSLSDSTLANPIASPENTTTYTVTVTTINGCSATDSVTINVVPKIVVNTGFSPNGDGMNDEWNIKFIDRYPNCEVEIYNRWGQLLFRSVGYTTPWDGMFNGEPLPVGTYYYIINLNDETGQAPTTGPVTILK